jgi:hypothetical protein
MLRQLIPILVTDTRLHARWLNTFSYLEYIGFRKIVKSQDAESLTLETLKHALEEGRHATRLKRMALKIGGPEFNSYQDSVLICREEAEAYFQSLDRICDSRLGSLKPKSRARMTYLYVTWLVEVRALSVYRAYQEFSGDKVVLKGLLAEEELHLASVVQELENTDPGFTRNAARLRQMEEGLYQDFITALTRELREAPEVGHDVFV